MAAPLTCEAENIQIPEERVHLEPISSETDLRGQKRSLEDFESSALGSVSPDGPECISKNLWNPEKEHSHLFYEVQGGSIHKKRRLEAGNQMVFYNTTMCSLSAGTVDVALSKCETSSSGPSTTSLDYPLVPFANVQPPIQGLGMDMSPSPCGISTIDHKIPEFYPPSEPVWPISDFPVPVSVQEKSTLPCNQTSEINSDPQVLTNVSHNTMIGIFAPSLSEHAIPKLHTDADNFNPDVQVLHETSNRIVTESQLPSPKSTHFKRKGSTSDPDSSRHVLAGSPTVDAMLDSTSSPMIEHKDPELSNSSAVGRGADLVMELVEENLKRLRAKHEREIATIKSNHMDEVKVLRQEEARKAQFLIEAKDKEIATIRNGNHSVIRKRQMLFDIFARRAENVEKRIKLLHGKLEGVEAKLNEARKRLQEKQEEIKKRHELQIQDEKKKITKVRRERLGEVRVLEGCLEREIKLRTSEAEASSALEQEITQLNEDRLKHEVVREKLEVWVKQMQSALAQQADDYQRAMLAANTACEGRIKAALEFGRREGETKGFELGKDEMEQRVNELTARLVTAEKAFAKGKDTWTLEKESLNEEMKVMAEKQHEERKRTEEMSQQIIKQLDIHWAKEIESRWEKLVATEEKRREDERVRQEGEEAARNANIEKREKEFAAMEEKMKALEQQLEEQKKARTDDALKDEAVELVPYSRTEAKAMLEQLTRHGENTPDSRMFSRSDDPCFVQ